MTIKSAPLWAMLLTILFVVSAKAVELPSDEEMIKRGRQEIGEIAPSIQFAQKEADRKVSPFAMPMETSNKGLTKSDVQELIGTRLPKNQAASKRGKFDLIIFVSFSMPDATLLEYSKQAKDAGAFMVLRGFYQNSQTKTVQKAVSINPEFTEYDINPPLFRKFKVNKVPSIILADAEGAEVVEDGCAQAGSYLKVDGDVSVQQALEIMRWQGKGKLAELAALKIKQIESKQ